MIIVATVLTVYGIETAPEIDGRYEVSRLQQYLPFTVLKRKACIVHSFVCKLQQYLPFTVLKQALRFVVGNLSTPLLQQYLPFTVLKP